MVVIQLAPYGRKNDKVYKITVCAKGSKLTGRYIDRVGIYKSARDVTEKDALTIDVEKYAAWIAKGAQPSPTLKKILLQNKVALPQTAAAPQAEKKAKPATEAKAAKAAPAKKAAAPAKKK